MPENDDGFQLSLKGGEDLTDTMNMLFVYFLLARSQEKILLILLYYKIYSKLDRYQYNRYLLVEDLILYPQESSKIDLLNVYIVVGSRYTTYKFYLSKDSLIV
jgi:hypothetical protein